MFYLLSSALGLEGCVQECVTLRMSCERILEWILEL